MDEAVAALPRESSGSAAAPARPDQPSNSPPTSTSTAANTPMCTGLTETSGRIPGLPDLERGQELDSGPARTRAFRPGGGPHHRSGRVRALAEHVTPRQCGRRAKPPSGSLVVSKVS
nr:hypothetical protein KPHV_08130 [Kitasatospora purpeofusca]